MAPLRLVALGFLLVIVDIRLGGLDLALDPIGWLMVIGGLGPLTSMNRWLRWARSLGVAALVITVLLFISFSFQFSAVLGTLSQLVVVAFVWCLTSGVLQAMGSRDRGMSTVLQLLRVAAPLPLVAQVLAGVLGLGGWMGPIAIVGLVATVALAVILWLVGDRHYLGANRF